MAPSCALDESGLRLQLERYRQTGRNARLIERTPRRLVADFDRDVDAQLVAEAVAVERECCPFLLLTWESDRRRLTVSVSQSAHEPALDAIALALNLQASGTLEEARRAVSERSPGPRGRHSGSDAGTIQRLLVRQRRRRALCPPVLDGGPRRQRRLA